MRIPLKWTLPAATLLIGVALGFVSRGWISAPSAKHSMPGRSGDYYVCEVHGHVHEGPGTCPVCGTELVPAEKMDQPAAKRDDRKVKYWRSPMDPTFVSKAPGKDNMGMDLVAVYEGDAEATAGVVTIEPVVMLQMGIRTGVLARGKLSRRIRTVGRVVYDEEKLGTVTSKLNVWVEKLYVDKTGQQVAVGDPLVEIYSKELEAAQVAFLDSLKDPRLTSKEVSAAERRRAANLLESSRRRLEYWDLAADQIEAIAKDGQVRRTLTLRSKFDGIVTKKNAVEGRFFKSGTALFEIADLDTVWVYASIYEFERPWIREGQPAKISLSYVPGKDYEGGIDYVYPYLNEKTRDITVRMRFDNPDGVLLPGMFANVSIDSNLGTDALLLPEEAVIDTGTRKIVFVERGPGKFEGREVRLGVRSGEGDWEVLDGLKPGERIVLSGQFLLDAESKVREAIRKFLEPDGQDKASSKDQGQKDREEGR